MTVQVVWAEHPGVQAMVDLLAERDLLLCADENGFRAMTPPEPTVGGLAGCLLRSKVLAGSGPHPTVQVGELRGGRRRPGSSSRGVR